MKILVVESPAKSKTISKYLGKEYKIVPSYGHIRDLPSKSGSVDPSNQFSMLWSISKTGSKCLKELKTLLKHADELLLATDPDREGEAIAWHILECLKPVLNNVRVKRVTFHEITKKAILEAIASPRDIDLNLVDAYLARRALDYLFGFSLSPVLWTKLPGCKSAGRVQSVALRILTDREDEIDAFTSQEYWSLDVQCLDKNQQQFIANVIAVNGEKLSKLSIENAEDAEKAKQALLQSDFIVKEVSEKELKKNPLPPFTTSTLQQDASKKLNFSTKKTMQIAQKLYEGIDIKGETQALITYMRTDSVNLSQDFVKQAREYLRETYGQNFIPNEPNIYKSKVKNAQEAHEAIRPINAALSPDQLSGCIDDDLLKVYTLIWQRAIASQMVPAIYNQTKIDITSTDDRHALRAIGTRLIFKGYLKIYIDNLEISDGNVTQDIPKVTQGDIINITNINCAQHFTQPPARYSEAGLVKKMEELGIGRPSTYATIIQVLQERKYAIITNKAFHPELRGRIVISFLTTYFAKYLQYDFTANMEEDLDDISNAQKSKEVILDSFWLPFSTSIRDIKQISMKDVIKSINTNMEKIIYGGNAEQKPKKCPKCKEGDLVLKLWSNAAFLGCSRYPDCDYKYYLLNQADSQETESKTASDKYPKIIGQDPVTKDDIILKFGPYGLYIELEPLDKDDKNKRKRISIPKAINENDITLEKALFLLSLPKQLGVIDGEAVSTSIGKYGPYILYKNKFTAIKNMDDFFSIDIDKAKQILKI